MAYVGNRVLLEFEGYDEFISALDSVGYLSRQGSILTNAMRYIVRPTMNDAKKMAPIDTGGLKRSHQFNRAGQLAVLMGAVKHYDHEGEDKGNLGLWMNNGTADRYTRDGEFRGRVKATKYFDNAWTKNAKRMETQLSAKVLELIDDYFEKGLRSPIRSWGAKDISMSYNF